MIGHGRRRFADTAPTSVIGVLMCAAATANAATLTVAVTNRADEPVGEAAIYAVPVDDARDATAPLPTAIMDQREQTFVPHMLVVEIGTSVEFPNHDTVGHHVYSFSDTKSFELPLYTGRAHAPIVFHHPGIVDIGCNIHDRMEAHIVVVDTPYFGVTSGRGAAELVDVPPGEYTIHIYTPRLPPQSQPASQKIVVANSAVHVEIPIESRLRPPHGESSRSLEWSTY